jgi:hypothetical protein
MIVVMMTLLKDSDRVVTGRLSSIDVKNFSSDETRRVEIHVQYSRSHTIEPRKHQAVNVAEGQSRRGFAPQHVEWEGRSREAPLKSLPSRPRSML